LKDLANSTNIYRKIFFGGIILLVIGMQFSHFLVSLVVMILSLNFFVEGGLKTKFSNFLGNGPVWLFFGLFVLHIIGMAWSENLDYALHDIQIKLPLFALPIILGASKKLSPKKFEWVLLFLIASSLVSSIIGLVIYFILSQPGDDYRLMSPFMSHIRLSLMMGVTVFSTFYLSQKTIQWQKYRGWFIGLGFWFIMYLFMLRAMSGIVAVMASGFIVIWIIASKQKMKFAGGMKAILLLGTLSSVGYIYWQVNLFYDIEEINLETADTHTKSGEAYYFDLDQKLYENGNYTYSFIAENELRSGWNALSELDFDGVDNKEQNLRATLTRYLTSKGLRKDTEGLKSLNHMDIWAVENGIANERFLNNKSLNTMIYRYIWEVHNYRIGFNPQGNSLGQRFLFWDIGTEIFKENWWYGVGTGDVQIAFNEKFDLMPYNVLERYRLRAHNQYLTMGITFGLFGLVYFIITLLSGFWNSPNSRSYLFIGTVIILMVSMLDEDTLETQFGVTYAAFYYFLILFHQPSKKELIAESATQ
jgi:hypothetical protein